MSRKIYENRGLTLVELILAVAIISIIVILMFSFLQFNYISFNKSNTDYNLQMSLSDLQRKIEEELKYAEKVTAIDNMENLGEYKNCIYLNNYEIKIKTVEGDYSITDINSILVTDLRFELNDNVIHVYIEGKSPDFKIVRNIEYSIELLNVINSEYKSGDIVVYSSVEGDD